MFYQLQKFSMLVTSELQQSSKTKNRLIVKLTSNLTIAKKNSLDNLIVNYVTAKNFSQFKSKMTSHILKDISHIYFKIYQDTYNKLK